MCQRSDDRKGNGWNFVLESWDYGVTCSHVYWKNGITEENFSR